MNIFGKKNKKEVKSLPKVDSSRNIRPVFGVPLAAAITRSKCHDGVPVPMVVRKCIDYITEHGMLLEGIYRISPPKAKLDELERVANSGGGRELRFNDAHEASGLLKRFLRQLPEHILTEKLKPKFDSVSSNCKCNVLCMCPCVEELRELMKSLPCENYSLLAYIFIHAQAVVEQQKFNKMSLNALGVLLQAMLNLSKNQVRIFLLNAVSGQLKEGTKNESGRLFRQDVDFKPYVPPKALNELKAGLPEMENALQEEMCKQRSLFHYLHNEAQIPNEKLREQEIWEVQEAIKIITNKLKTKQGHMSTFQETFPETTARTNASSTNGDRNREEDIKVSSVLLEKQLIAIQSSLKDEITAEKRNIAQLLTRLREIRSQLPTDALEKLSRNPFSKRGESTSHFNGTEKDDKTQENNSLKEELTQEVVRLRNLCAQLRARLEEDSVLLTNAAVFKAKGQPITQLLHLSTLNATAQSTQKRQEEVDSLLVTRF